MDLSYSGGCYDVLIRISIRNEILSVVGNAASRQFSALRLIRDCHD